MNAIFSYQLLGLLVLFALPPAVQANDFKNPKPVLLWEEGAPGAKGKAEEDKPSIRVYRPAKEKANGTAVIICPGGGYGHLAITHEGSHVARWFRSFGVTAVVLKYRLGPKYHHPAPLQDVSRAIRYIRANAKKYGIQADRIGVMGFSAGGHLASTVSTHFDAGKSKSKDPVERVSSRPDFSVLCYPVISSKNEITHRGSMRNLLGKKPDTKLLALLSNETQVTKETPTTFLFHTAEDPGVKVENSLVYFAALRKNNVPAEMHIYQNGPHGVGMASGNPILSTWKKRLRDWMKASGLLSNVSRGSVKGRIMIDGKPLNHGTIAFIPPHPKTEPTAWSSVSRGYYNIPLLRGAVAGLNKIEVRDIDSEEIKVISKEKEITVEIKPRANVIPFDLKTE